MLIGVDGASWHNTRGYGRHARALLSTLVRMDQENHYTFFFDSPKGLEGVPPQAHIELVGATRPTAIAASASGRRSVPDMRRMSQALSNKELDLLLFPTIYSYVPVFSRAKKIVMIHDVIAERFPQFTTPNAAARLFWKVKVALGRWQADAIVTVSDYSRQELIKQFRLPPEQVFVVGEASDPVFRLLENPDIPPRLTSTGFDADKRSVIYVGGFGPHKNLLMLVNAFANVCSQEQFSDIQLVLVGEYRREAFFSQISAIKERITALDIEDRVLFTGYLPDEELVVLLNVATVLVLPSLMEGFGLPAVEAAACGCPVIATTASPLPALLGGGGIYIDPGDRTELERSLTEVLTSDLLQQRMSQAGLIAARALTWEAAAQQLIDIINETISL